MKKMHERMARMYEAARSADLLDQTKEQASLSRLLNVAQQNVNNWESRGPSKEAVLEAQHRLGISATWVLLGKPPMMIGGDIVDLIESKSTGWPFGDMSRYDQLSPQKKRELARIVDAFLAGAEPEKSDTYRKTG